MASPGASPDSSSLEGPAGPGGSPTSDCDNLSPDELQLLAKLEEQNRLLEADSKSMRSVNGSRRNSGSSLVSSSSASSNLSHLEEDTWILWGRIVNEWDDWRRKKEKLLKELIRKGIPHHFRAIVWQLLCSAAELPLKAQYSELLRMSSPCERLIRRDIARTYPEHDFFKGQDSLGQEVLFNVMKAYSLVDREVGYCQGSAFIVGLLLMWGHLGHLGTLGTPGDTRGTPGDTQGTPGGLGTPGDTGDRQGTGLEIVFRVGMALLQFNQAELVQLDMEGMSQYFQKVIPHQFDSCPDKLILRACQVKYNPRKMKRLEKEYAALKSKEMEEQIEIKRLRSENRLLKQRIETLEKGQVTRAQEAEENDVIRRELALVRQRCTSATESLRRAQSTIRELQGNPRLTEEFVAHLETELERSRLRESETLGALKEMQDKVLDMEKGELKEMQDKVLDVEKVTPGDIEVAPGLAGSQWEGERQPLLPDESSVVRLQEELQELALSDLGDTWQVCGGRWKEPRALQEAVLGVQLRESHAQAELRALRQRVLHLETQVCGGRWKEPRALQEAVLGVQLRESHAQAELRALRQRVLHLETQSKEEVMAVRLREADSMAALAEMRQRVAELEIQREEGRLQGQLEHSDAAQYIRHLKGHISELKAEIRLLRGPLSFGAVALGTRLGDEDSLGSSDEELPPPFPLSPGDIGDTGDTGDSSDSEPEVAPTAP
ncbi:hypothetical protein HGM15179_020677 [Zosterops borbonicus]|uniref:Rab-GAP TBC domain-containing protein n=1 Tax=Zosterops borbonicus TaxID=364589 RepID=A0A8K1FXH8_9PASS|nr:hypothetical protein HGM15179_020677 [Zosterops borbonicus]